MKIAETRSTAKIDELKNQEVTRQLPTVNTRSGTHHAAHEFRWIETKAGGSAFCSCGRWQLYSIRPGGLTRELAKKNHALHRSNVAEGTVGHDRER